MSSASEPTLSEVTFEELERVDQFEATFTGTVDGEEITLTYALESAIGPDGQAIYTPDDPELDNVVAQPETYEFETDDQETVRFTATDEDGGDIFMVYAFTEAEDADANRVGLSVDTDA